jgi:mannose-6-phosphate isomerase
MWYILNARKGAHVYAGLTPGTHRHDLEQAAAEGTLDHIMATLLVRRGQAIYIPGGRVHAIGEGCLILEVQQNSNTTYRVHDWNRRDGATGRPRELHLEDALRCIRWDDKPARLITPRFTGMAGHLIRAQVTRCPFFRVREYRLRAGQSFRNSGRSFHAYFTTTGRARVSTAGGVADTAPGVSFLLPAAARTYRVDPLSPEVRLIRTTL